MQMHSLNPETYGLASRIKLIALSDNRVGIQKIIKSRIIQQDALKIVEIAEQIKTHHNHVAVTLICTHNICSKSIARLSENNIDIQYVDLL